MRVTVKEAQAAVSGALLAIWGAEFMSYNIVPKVRRNLRLETDRWMDDVNRLDHQLRQRTDKSNAMKELGSIRDKADEQMRLCLREGPLYNPPSLAFLIDPLWHPATLAPSGTLNLIAPGRFSMVSGFAQLIDAVASSPGARALRSRENAATERFDRFIAARRRRWTSIESLIKLNKSEVSQSARFERECTILAQWQLEANLLLDKDVELGSHHVAFFVHARGCMMHVSLIGQVWTFVEHVRPLEDYIEDEDEDSFDKIIHENKKQTLALIKVYDILYNEASVRPGRSDANAMAALDKQLKKAYIDLIDHVYWIQPRVQHRRRVHS